ncbi:MAG: Gfo/Idh/MocA family oxidoreductase [Verrucomicrobiales bacterium]|nr:Gfo/Idh/MocA family oxidoreductase [Verrucomicrobiales bacterium]
MNRTTFSNQLSRRRFVQSAGALGAILASGQAPSLLSADAPSRTVRVAVMGLNRGMAHVQAFLQVPQVEIAAVCDVDDLRVAAAVKTVREKTGQEPKGVRDFRRLLEDPSIDAISIAAPNFWHAPATILACSAGKHVYVEKPGSHNAKEGELMVAAARKQKRHVQMGNQRRSMPIFIQAMEELHQGVVGPLRFSRCWYDAARGSIGRGKSVPVPASLDYTLWQGPTPERPYVDNLVHYNWHWRWHWGGGELANNGIHTLDLARWGLGVDYPRHVSCQGGRYHFQDDQETPDTILATYDFGHCGISWDGSSCHQRQPENHPFLTFYGDGGSLSLTGNQYTIWDSKGKKVRTESGSASDVHHFANFVDAIRKGTQLNSEIEVGQKSTLLCHLGNIAWRTQTTLNVDSSSGGLLRPTRAQAALWTRDYRPGWKPKV